MDSRGIDSLSDELWAAIFSTLSKPRDLFAAAAVSKACRRAFDSNATQLLMALESSPSVQPYQRVNGTIEPSALGRVKALQSTRSAWRQNICASQLINFENYVRVVKVVWEPSPYMLVGMYNGCVAAASMDGSWQCLLPGRHLVGQAIALDAAGGYIISGSGEPSYHGPTPCADATMLFIACPGPPWLGSYAPVVVHQFGRVDGGHADSIFAIRKLDDYHVASAGADAQLLVWRLDAVSPSAKCRTASTTSPSVVTKLVGHTAAIRALVLVDENTLLSCGHDANIIEWAWREGKPLRRLLGPDEMRPCTPRIAHPLSALSYHAQTRTLAVGDQIGCCRIFRLEPASSASSNGRNLVLLSESNDSQTVHSKLPPSARHEVATIQHDGDKIVYGTRSGHLRVCWMSLPESGGEEEVTSLTGDGFGTCASMRVRLYISSVAYRGDTLVADGFDNQVLVLRHERPAQLNPTV